MAVSVATVMRSNGVRKPHKDRAVWNQHEVDQGFWHGKSNKTRGNVATRPQIGASLRFAGMKMHEFLSGASLYVQGDYQIVEPIQNTTLGYADAATAIGYRNAAALKGVTLEVYQCTA